MNKIVSVLGWKENHYQEMLGNVKKLCYNLSKFNYHIQTGAGGGFMNAANYGAYEDNPFHSFGTKLVQFDDIDDSELYIPKDNLTTLNSYTIRKKSLILTADYLVFCPGGFGTLDEFTEAINYKRMERFKGKIYCYGFSFWNGMKIWIESNENMKWPEDAIEMITDDVTEIFIDIIKTDEQDE